MDLPVTPEMAEPGKHRAEGWGPREIIALVIIVLSFLLAGIAQVLDKPGVSVPAWVVALVSGVALYYYKNGEAK